MRDILCIEKLLRLKSLWWLELFVFELYREGDSVCGGVSLVLKEIDGGLCIVGDGVG